MKKVLVYDVAAESGGALTILNNYYQKFLTEEGTQAYFALSVLDYPEKNGIHMIRLPWVKKSWLHRLYCDYVYIPKLIQQYQIDEVLSLQNMAVPRCNAFQTVYVQNVLPFTAHDFSLLKEPYLWVYKHLIGRLTKHSLARADAVIVQTAWMKKAVCQSAGIADDKVRVERFQSDFSADGTGRAWKSKVFFYPASCRSYKNHETIIKACKNLAERGITDYQVVFTFSANESRLAKRLCTEIQKHHLPVECVGRLDQAKMADYYAHAALLFPSYLETIGLPLIEAQNFNAPMIVADCEYSRESVGHYKHVTFFYPDSDRELSDAMLRMIHEAGRPLSQCCSE